MVHGGVQNGGLWEIYSINGTLQNLMDLLVVVLVQGRRIAMFRANGYLP